MKIKHLFISALLLLSCGATQAQHLIAGSFNLRFNNSGDTGNLWENRAPVAAALIRFHDFDVIGTQEGRKVQLDDLSKALPEYERYGLGRDDGKEGGEHSAIFFKKDRFQVLKKGNFWLSETPDKPGLGWDATCCNRICSWVYLLDKQSKKKFYFFNAHFDHEGKVAREESSKLILKKIKEIAGNEKAVFTGDLNGDHESTWYQRLATSDYLKDTYSMAKHPYFFNASFNNFGKALDKDGIIDHVFVTGNADVKRWGILTDSYRGKFPSDHFPVLTEFTF
ncbi:endonuclease/exonuclease/phosphatase family protein [Mucilaginibacter sp. JRF]|uniref:endonuclease/exonuclease/phosphatase family protein n=1 Tax=Mucilaginibacter sp. JRF TaxID=2780088 RepID=UPI0018808135|nr:endonuclease/exonuclease/phosphatase family protein [Mucilaginibacter sp. JRF]MBE9584952.1 endonuclease/exonuclease/phosphatase family protein [Mucilaginibacter sp. JRF]